MLDHNFPEPILLDAITRWVLELDLRRLKDVDARLTASFEDWQVVLALSQAGYDGLRHMRRRHALAPRGHCCHRTAAMSVVVCESVGDDPVAASGLLLVHLPRVAKRFVPQKPQIWRLRATEQKQMKFSVHKATVEGRTGQRIADYHLTKAELQRPVI